MTTVQCNLFLAVRGKIFSTSYVTNQIENLGLLVRIAFVGEDNLIKVASYLERRINSDESYLLLHYEPSTLTTKFEYTNVKFEPCRDEWGVIGGVARSALSQDCYYAPQRLAKVGNKARKRLCFQ